MPRSAGPDMPQSVFSYFRGCFAILRTSLLSIYFLKRDTCYFRCSFVVALSGEANGKIGVMESKQNKKISGKLQKPENFMSGSFRSVHSVLITDLSLFGRGLSTSEYMLSKYL